MSALPASEPLVLRPAPDSRPPVIESAAHRADDSRWRSGRPGGWAQWLDDQPPLPLLPIDSLSEHTPIGDVAGLGADRQTRAWAAALALALFEALHGRRSLGQLSCWVDASALAKIAAHRRRSASKQPAHPAVLRSVRVQLPSAGAAEVSAHLGVGARSYALALRLEAVGGHWLCVAAEFA